jgi:hypothetical protein
VPALTSFRPLELRLAPEYRRCALYVAIGYVAIVALLVWFTIEEINNAPWSNTIIVLSIIGIGTLSLVALVTRFRIRIDEKGVWRRRFMRWDVWPWQAFEQGKVRHGKLGDQLTYPEKSWYRRTISASLLGKKDRAAFEAVVAHYLTLPPPPELPAKILIKHGIGRRLELSVDGVRLGKHDDKSTELIPWRDVFRVEIFRATHGRPDFATLNLHIAGKDKPVSLRKQNGAACWKGATAEEIALFVQTHVDESRIELTAYRGHPRNIAEVNRWMSILDNADKQLRTLRRASWWAFGIGVTGMTALILEPWNRPNPMNWGPDDWIHAAVVFTSFVVLNGLLLAMGLGVSYFKRREIGDYRAEVVGWREGLERPTTRPPHYDRDPK